MVSKILWDQIPVIFEGFFFLFILWQTLKFFCGTPGIPRGDRSVWLFMLFGIYIVINALFQDTMKELTRAVYEYIFYIFPMYTFIQYRSRIDILKCLKVTSIIGLIIIVLSWYEYITRHYLIKDLSGGGTILHVGSYGFRAAVFTRSYISHGMILGVFCLIGFYLWIETKQKKWLLNSIFAYISIITTGSRGPLVSFSAALVFFYYIEVFCISRKRNKKNRFILAALILSILVIGIFSIPVTSANSFITYSIYRVQSIFDWVGDAGNVGRLGKWSDAINDWFLKSPIWGIGPSKTGSWSRDTLGVTESGVLRRLCEFGIAGFTIFYSFILEIVKNSVRSIEHLTSSQKTEMVLWISIFIAIFINDITVQTTEEIMVSFWWWISLGGIYSLKYSKYRVE